jgi:hypothetical protein
MLLVSAALLLVVVLICLLLTTLIPSKMLKPIAGLPLTLRGLGFRRGRYNG